jgi:ABC-type branched-subunit amino acid transport system substrate-binding protein
MPHGTGCRGDMVSMRRGFSIPACLLVLALLVGCRPLAYTCTDPLGCLEISYGSPLVIGSLLATSGPQALSGETTLHIFEATIVDKELLFGHTLKLYQQGSDCSPESAFQAATALATYPELAAVLGPTCEVEYSTARLILAAAGIPLLGPLPDPLSAGSALAQLLSALQQVAQPMPDGSLLIPRQALFDVLQLTR